MPLTSVLDIAGSGLSAQSVRLNTISSNLANVNSVSGIERQVYRPRHPVFASVLDHASRDGAAVGVRVTGIVEDRTSPIRRYEPNNPLANDEGFVFQANVNSIEEMANLISASRSFQNNVEVFKTTKNLLLATLRLGQ